MHEDAGQMLTGVHMLVNEHIRHLKDEGFEDLSGVECIRDLIKDVDDRLLRLARGIIPLKLSGSGNLRHSLMGLARDDEERSDIRCTTRIDRDLSLGSDEQATHVYRVAEEAVQNAVLHGDASEVTVRLTGEDDTCMLTIANNGKSPEGERAE